MEPMTTRTTTTTIDHAQPKRAAVNGLAVVGFIALIFIGITLAIYAAQYVPKMANLGAANVYFSSLFSGEDEDPNLEVVPATIPFDNDDEDKDNENTNNNDDEDKKDDDKPSTPAKPTTPAPAPKPVLRAVPVPGTAAPMYGKADLTVRLTERGYLKSADIDSFVKSSSVPEGKRPAVKFRVTNAGTNETDDWVFKAKLPTKPAYTYESRKQQSLNPGQFADYTLGYDRPKDGDNTIVITLDTDDDVDESNERNNTLSIEVEVED